MTTLSALGRRLAAAACTIVLSGVLLLGAVGPATAPVGPAAAQVA